MGRVNDAEYLRMRQQAEQKFAYTSEIAFLCKYVDSAATPAIEAVEWEETGYIADFKPIGSGSITKSGRIYGYSQDAMCRMPMRYYTNPASFVVKQAPIAAPMGKTFKINVLRSGSPFLVNGVVSCTAVRLKNYLNVEPKTFQDISWTVVAEPQIEADCVTLYLEGSETLSVYDWMKADFNPVNKYTRLYLDAKGNPAISFGVKSVKR